MTFPQSSFYASNRRDSYPQLLPRFGSSDDNSTNTSISNRIGEGNDSATGNNSYSPDSVHGIVETNRVASWPKERQPFWYINQQHINSHRGQQIPCTGTNCANSQQSVQQPLP